MTTLLIIEDDATIRDNVAMLLDFRGYTCVVAPDGQAGISRFHEHHPDLIICDVNMPHMDGYAVLSEVRSLTYGARVPFIFLTANKSEDDIRRGMLSGADDYISKPFTDEDLLSAVESRLKKQQQNETAILQLLARRMLLDNDAFKKRLAGNLKTDIIDSLNAVQLLLDAFMRQNNSLQNLPLLGEINAQLQSMRTAGEQLYLRLTPDHLAGLGIVATVHWLVSQYYTDALTITFQHDDLPHELPAHLPQHVVAIVDELLQNSIEHGSAKNINVHMHTQTHMLHVSVEDDGTGFDVDAFWQHVTTLGLVMVRERVRLCGGRLAIMSQAETGTSVHCTLSLLETSDTPADQAPPLTVKPTVPITQQLVATRSVVIAHSHALTLSGLEHIILGAPHLTVIATCNTKRALSNLLADSLQTDTVLVSVALWQSLDTTVQTIAKDVSRVVLLEDDTHRVSKEILTTEDIQGCLHEDAVVEELVSLIEAVGQGKRVHSTKTQQDEDRHLLERLTRRERQVLEYVAQGYQNAGIAEALVISIRTVETHRANMMHKLNLGEKAELIKFALKHGIITVEDL